MEMESAHSRCNLGDAVHRMRFSDRWAGGSSGNDGARRAGEVEMGEGYSLPRIGYLICYLVVPGKTSLVAQQSPDFA